MTSFDFDITVFPNNRVAEGVLHGEFLADATVGSSFLFVSRAGTVVTVWFSIAVLLADVQAVIDAHLGSEATVQQVLVSAVVTGVPTTVEILSIAEQPLLRLSDGTFVRASDANWVNDDGDIVRRFLTGELRIVDAGRYAIEGVITNHVSDDPVDISVGGGWAAVGAATFTDDDGVAPDGETTASLLTFTASAADAAAGSLDALTGATLYRVTCFVRATSGTKAFRLGYNDATAGDDISADQTATTAWQRFTHTFTSEAVPNTPTLRIQNDSGAGAGAIQVWGAQIQDDAANLHPSPVLTASGTKVRDDLEFAIATAVPAAMLDDGFWFYAYPYFDDDEQESYGTEQNLIANGNLGNKILFGAAATHRLSVRSVAGGTSNTGALTWTARTRLTIVIDWAADEIRLAGFDSGNGTTGIATADTWSGITGNINIGNNDAGSRPYWGDFSDLFPLATAPI